MSQIPLRFGTDEQFARVKEAFLRAGFQEEKIYGEERDDDGTETFEPYPGENHAPLDLDPASLCTALFLRAASATPGQLEKALGAQGVEALSALGMIAPAAADGTRISATVRVRPMFDLHVISDHWNTRAPGLADDIVYPPDIGNTVKYLSFVPTSPSQRFLEACGGSGVAALVASRRFAEHAWSYDITERSTEFARFSGRLNGLANFSVGCGDTFAPAEGRTFDRIVAHPPYVPVLKPTWIYHGGGVDGEAVTRKLVEGLPAHLEPGGRFLCRCVGTDREGQNFEHRIRWWLGEAASDFDVAVYVLEAINPIYYVTVSILRGRSQEQDLPAWRRAFEEAGILRFVSCFFVVQRRAGPREVFTVRRDHGPQSGPRGLEWLLQWETLRRQPGILDRILQSRLRAGPVSLRTKHGLRNGEWAIEDQMLATPYPFQISWPVEGWTVLLLARADGSRTGLELHQLLRAEEIIHDEVTPQEFAGALAELISGGLLLLEGFAPPPAPARTK